MRSEMLLDRLAMRIHRFKKVGQFDENEVPDEKMVALIRKTQNA